MKLIDRPNVYPPDMRTLRPHQDTVRTTPIPARPLEKFVSALEGAACWAPDLGEDIAVAVADLIQNAKNRITGRAA